MPRDHAGDRMDMGLRWRSVEEEVFEEMLWDVTVAIFKHQEQEMEESLLGEFCQKNCERLYREDASTVRVVSEKIHVICVFWHNSIVSQIQT